TSCHAVPLRSSAAGELTDCAQPSTSKIPQQLDKIFICTFRISRSFEESFRNPGYILQRREALEHLAIRALVGIADDKDLVPCATDPAPGTPHELSRGIDASHLFRALLVGGNAEFVVHGAQAVGRSA